MSPPVFSEMMQIGIVVRDLDAAIRTYEDVYGIGPWEKAEFHLTPESPEGLRSYGEPVTWAWRGANTTVGHVMWELIQPLDGESHFARFLAEKGEGVHHIGLATPDYDRTMALHASRGNGAALYGVFGGTEIAHVDTRRDLGVMTEVFRERPDDA